MSTHGMRKVPAAEFKTHFGAYREAAQHEPIGVTSHGRTSVILLSAAEYERLKALDTRRPAYVSEIKGDDWSQIMADDDMPAAAGKT